MKVILSFSSADRQRMRGRGLGVDYRVAIRIITRSKPAATVIPRSALFRGAEGKWQVFIVHDGRARLQGVETGLLNDDSVEVVKGLAAGNVVVLAPETSLSDGARVSPKLRELEPPATPAATD